MSSHKFPERWEVVCSLGEGGQAHIYKVKDRHGGAETEYAYKRLKNDNRIERFKRELQAIRDLCHPNIVRLIDFDLDWDSPYLVTELYQGGSLEKPVAGAFWKGSPITALRLFKEVCEGVAYAHLHGIVHRDIKPENIFLRDDKQGPAVVGDFGICYIDEKGDRITLTDEVVGARRFTAPELEDGRSDGVSPKSDVYSLGKLLYWLLSGGDVFPREQYREQKWDLKGHNLDSPTGWDNIYMEHINRLLDLMMSTDPGPRRGVDNILILLRRAERLVREEFNPIAKDIPQPCHYCGQGLYVVKAKDNSQTSNIGFTPVANCDWRVLVCNKCGHLQAFRVDMAQKKEWWG